MTRRFSFDVSRRLTRGGDFARIFAQGRRLRCREFVLLILPNELGHPRLGISVPKRRLQRATARNRIKRVIRESFRHNAERLGAVDVIVMLVSSEAAHRSTVELRQTLELAWQRLTA